MSSFSQYGGMKRRPHASPTSGKKKPKEMMQAIQDMIASPGATLEVLTCSSLKGFMFTLTVQPEHSEFLKQGPGGGKFIVPETEFIIKFCIASDNEYGITAYKFPPTSKKPEDKVSKETESVDGFFEEAKLQQAIWRNSVGAGKEPLCPPVAAFQILQHARVTGFLSAFRTFGLCTAPKSEFTVKYLVKEISKHPIFHLGILLMPKIPLSQTMGMFLDPLPVGHADRLYMKSMLLAKVIRLFIEGKSIHFDLHPGNGMVFQRPGPDRSLGTILIDFGRASNLRNPRGDAYLTPQEKIDFLTLIDGDPRAKTMGSRFSAALPAGIGLYDECLAYCSTPGYTDQHRADYLSKVLRLLIDIEYGKSQAKFHDPSKPADYPVTRYQTDWVEELFLPGQTISTPGGFSIQPQLVNVIFQELCRMLMVQADRASSCVKLGKKCLEFTASDTAAMFTQGGGRVKRSKKSKKTKKSKKSKKSKSKGTRRK